ncbi:MAG: hypothetical protein ACO363_08605, partial [Balneolaceae bacterium]
PILPGILYVSVALTVSVTMHFTSTNIINSESSIHPIHPLHQSIPSIHSINPSHQSIPSTRT